jgi:hypothetical protein
MSDAFLLFMLVVLICAPLILFGCVILIIEKFVREIDVDDEIESGSRARRGEIKFGSQQGCLIGIRKSDKLADNVNWFALVFSLNQGSQK